MKPILKRIFPFIIGGAVVVFAACQDTQAPNQSLSESEVLEHRRGPSLRAQINRAINKVWRPRDPDRRRAHRIKARMYRAGEGTPGAQTYATELIELALASNASTTECPAPRRYPRWPRRFRPCMEDVEKLIDLVSLFAGSPPPTVVEGATGGVVTDDPADLPGLAGVQFQPNDLPPGTWAVTVELVSLPCHPLDQLPVQAADCVSITTIPALPPEFEFPGLGVLFAVCTDINAPNFSRLSLFESEGPSSTNPVKQVPEETTPSFIIGAGTASECQTGIVGSTESNWLGDFAKAGWNKVGRPLASLFAPQPAYAAVVARAGSLGGRTKNFSNFGWAELGLDYGSDGYRYMENPPSGFESPIFDDSGWAVGGAPFWDNTGFTGCPAITPAPGVGTTWTLNTDIVLRRSFVLPAGATNVRVEAAIDNDIQVWINGVEVSSGVETHEGCATEGFFNASVNIGDLTVPGVNLLVVRGVDRGVMAYVDAQVTYDINGGGD